ncbi:hypothetical protein [Mycobacterium sp. SMC-4]|uniref:hypothetical protein n=1 Tax=Mycobacterium sp. SMC-4 TaxID=2857059 RepID=UPI0021B37992|nr:hypothetical protein [Mycobacterium sp. SMC-4]UXA19313.1 hypothetical protein KXD98_06755 [Mycobacterium sp. SMC-4]
MGRVFVGTEAVASGAATPGELRYTYRRLFPNVYVPRDEAPSLTVRTVAASLWSGRQGVITGRAAAAWHGSRWVDSSVPIELVHDCKRPPTGIITRNERIAEDEYVLCDGLAVATVERAAFDLGRFLPFARAVEQLDALANRTELTADGVLALAERYQGARGTRRLRRALDMMNSGAQSPKETWLRLLLIRAGFPRPETQIPVFDDYGHAFAYLDMGWKDLGIAVEYDGDHHRERAQYRFDIQRVRKIEDRGYLHIKVINEDRDAEIIARVRQAWALRESALTVARRAS